MTLPDVTASRLGQSNASGSATALFLKVFSGEVLGTFTRANVMGNLHTVRTIENGLSAQFPVIGNTTAAYHTPGAMIDGDAIKHAERVISIDGILLSKTYIASIDDAMNHYDVRAEYAKQLGLAISNKYDKQTLQVAVLAARAATTITSLNGGSTLTNGAYATDGEAIADGIFDAAQALDEKDVPQEDRFFVCRPKQFFLLARSTKVLNRDWGGQGSYANASGLKIAGVNVVMSNNLPITNISADSPAPVNTYHGDFSTTVGVLFQKSAVGTVKLRDMVSSVDWMPQNEAWLLKTKIICGHGILRPESSVEFKTL